MDGRSRTNGQQALKIVQWNVEGVWLKKTELQHFLKLKAIDVCCMASFAVPRLVNKTGKLYDFQTNILEIILVQQELSAWLVSLESAPTPCFLLLFFISQLELLGSPSHSLSHSDLA